MLWLSDGDNIVQYKIKFEGENFRKDTLKLFNQPNYLIFKKDVDVHTTDEVLKLKEQNNLREIKLLDGKITYFKENEYNDQLVQRYEPIGDVYVERIYECKYPVSKKLIKGTEENIDLREMLNPSILDIVLSYQKNNPTKVGEKSTAMDTICSMLKLTSKDYWFLINCIYKHLDQPEPVVGYSIEKLRQTQALSAEMNLDLINEVNNLLSNIELAETNTKILQLAYDCYEHTKTK